MVNDRPTGREGTRPAGSFLRAQRAAREAGGTARVSSTGEITVSIPIVQEGVTTTLEERFERGEIPPQTFKRLKENIERAGTIREEAERPKTLEERQAQVTVPVTAPPPIITEPTAQPTVISEVSEVPVVTPTVEPTVSPEFELAVEQQEKREEEQAEREQRTLDIFRAVPGLASDAFVQRGLRAALAAPTLFSIGLGGAVAEVGEKIGLAVGAGLFEPAARENVIREVFRTAPGQTPQAIKEIVTSPEFIFTLPLIVIGARARAPRAGKLSQVDSFAALNEQRTPPGTPENIRVFETATISKTEFGSGTKAKTDFGGAKGTIIATETAQGELTLSAARLQAFDSKGKPIGTIKEFDLTKPLDAEISRGFGVSKLGDQPTEGFAFQTRKVIDIEGGTLEFTSGELRTKPGEVGVPTRIITGTKGLPSEQPVSPFFGGLQTIKTTKLSPEAAVKLQGAVESVSRQVTKQIPGKPIIPALPTIATPTAPPTEQKASFISKVIKSLRGPAAITIALPPAVAPSPGEKPPIAEAALPTIITPTPFPPTPTPSPTLQPPSISLITGAPALTIGASATQIRLQEALQIKPSQITSVLMAQQEIQKLREVQQERLAELQRQAELQGLGLQESLAQKTAEAQALALATAQQQALEQRLELLQATATAPKLVTLPKPKIAIRFPFPIPPGTKEKLKKTIGEARDLNVKGWILEIRRRNKFNEIGTFSRSQALKLGAKISDLTLASTLRVTPTNKIVKETSDPFVPGNKFRNFIIRQGQRISTPNQWIEKKQFRLDSPTETRAIQRARSRSSLLGIKRRKKKGRKQSNMNLLEL